VVNPPTEYLPPWEKGLMDKDTYDNWTRDLKYFLTTKDTTRFMSMWRDIFETSFVKHIDELIVESKKQQAQKQQNIRTSAKSGSATTTTNS
jgi:hypothetical protein